MEIQDVRHSGSLTKSDYDSENLSSIDATVQQSDSRCLYRQSDSLSNSLSLTQSVKNFTSTVKTLVQISWLLVVLDVGDSDSKALVPYFSNRATTPPP